MPFFPALPEPRPAAAHPFSALIGGVGAAQEVMGQAARTRALREVAAQPERQREAMKAYVAGDPSQIMTVNPDMAMRLDENQRKIAASAAENIAQMAPYIDTPEKYSSWRNDFYKAHPGVSQQMLPPGDKVTTPGQVKDIMNRGVQQAIDIKRQMGELEGTQRVKTEKEISKTVRQPEMELQYKLRGQLQTQVDSAHYKLSTDLADKRIGFEKEVKSDLTKEKREGLIMTNFRFEMNKLDEIEKALEVDIDKQGLPEDQARMMKQELRLSMNAKRNRAADYYRPYAAEYKIPWNPPREPERSATGPPLGTDPAFDRAMARAGNDPALRQAVISRWQSLNPEGAVREPAPAAAPEPVPAPKPARKPARKPVAPAPRPAPAPVAALAPAPRGGVPTVPNVLPGPEAPPVAAAAMNLASALPLRQPGTALSGPGLQNVADRYFQPTGAKSIAAGWQGPGPYALADGRIINIRDINEFKKLMGL